MVRLYTGLAHHSINTDQTVVVESTELKMKGGQKLHIGLLAESLSGGETAPAIALRAALESLRSDTTGSIPDLIHDAFMAAQNAVVKQAEYIGRPLATALALAVIVNDSHFYLVSTGHCVILHYRHEQDRYVRLASDPWPENEREENLAQIYIGSDQDAVNHIASHAHVETLEPGDALLILSSQFAHRTAQDQLLLTHKDILDAMTDRYGRHTAEMLVQQASEQHREADFAALTFQSADMAFIGGPWSDRFLRVGALLLILAGIGSALFAFGFLRTEGNLVPSGDLNRTSDIQVVQGLPMTVTVVSTSPTNPQEVAAITSTELSPTALTTVAPTDTLIPTNTSAVIASPTPHTTIGTGSTSSNTEIIPVRLNSIVRTDANETLLININHDPQTIMNEATLLLAPRTSVQLTSATDTPEGSMIELALGRESITFVETGGYDRARVALTDIPGLFVDVAGSCMKVEYIDRNTFRVACYDGDCVLSNSTDQLLSVPVGMEATFSAVPLQQQYRVFIYRDHAEDDMSLFESVQSEDLNTCIAPYLGRMAPTAKIIPSATTTSSPAPPPQQSQQQSQRQDVPEPSDSEDSENPEPTAVPIPDEPTVEPTPEQPDEPTNEPETLPTDAPPDDDTDGGNEGDNDNGDDGGSDSDGGGNDDNNGSEGGDNSGNGNNDADSGSDGGGSDNDDD